MKGLHKHYEITLELEKDWIRNFRIFVIYNNLNIDEYWKIIEVNVPISRPWKIIEKINIQVLRSRIVRTFWKEPEHSVSIRAAFYYYVLKVNVALYWSFNLTTIISPFKLQLTALQHYCLFSTNKNSHNMSTSNFQKVVDCSHTVSHTRKLVFHNFLSHYIHNECSRMFAGSI